MSENLPCRSNDLVIAARETQPRRFAGETENGVTTYLRSTLLGGQVVSELNSSGQWTRGYVYLDGQMVAIQQNSAVSWVHQDPVTKHSVSPTAAARS